MRMQKEIEVKHVDSFARLMHARISRERKATVFCSFPFISHQHNNDVMSGTTLETVKCQERPRAVALCQQRKMDVEV